MKEVEPQLIETFCTQDEIDRPNVFCKLVLQVLSKQDMQQEERYPCFSPSDSQVDSV